MTNDIYKSEQLIEKYIRDELNSNELKDFQKRLNNDPEFAAQVKIMRLTNEALLDQKVEEDANFISAAYSNILSPGQKADFDQKTDTHEQFRQKSEIFNKLMDTFESEPTELNQNIFISDFFRSNKRKVVTAAAILIVLFSSIYIIKQLVFNINNIEPAIVEEIDTSKTKQEQDKSENITDNRQQKNKDDNKKQPEKHDTETENAVAPEKEKNHTPTLDKLLQEYIALKNDKKDVELIALADQYNVNLPESYKENSFYEMRLKANFRSWGVKINEPAKFQLIDSFPVVFEWTNGNGQITITINDNRRKQVWTNTVTDSQRMICNEKLNPGTYYWTLKTGDKVQTLRQFVVVEK